MELQLVSEIIQVLIAIGVGMGMGSCSTMVYYRSEKGEAWGGKWTGKRAYCPKCNHKLRTRDLLPLFNWILTLGKCKFCGAKINPVYFFIEFMITALSVIFFLKYGFIDSQFYILTFGLAACLVIIVATDYSYKLVPDKVLLVMVMFGFLYRPLIDEEIYSMIRVVIIAVLFAILYSKLYEALTKKPIVNYGYLKLIGIGAIWFDYLNFFIFLILSAICYLLIMIINRIFGFKTPLPYAAALAFPMILLLLQENLLG